MGGITITKVPARHGDNLETVAYLGESSGYVLQGEDKTLYLAGDTVYFDGMAQTIDTYHPDVIVLNCSMFPPMESGLFYRKTRSREKEKCKSMMRTVVRFRQN